MVEMKKWMKGKIKGVGVLFRFDMRGTISGLRKPKDEVDDHSSWERDAK